MLIFSLGLIVVSLFIMMYEDYLHRAISVRFLGTFFLGCILFGFIQNDLSDWLLNSLINTFLLAFLFVVMQVYYKLRFRVNGWFTDKIIGKGDLLFFWVLGWLFSPFNFLITLSFLSLLSIVLSLPKIMRKGFQHKLPLITYMGIGLIIEFAIIYRHDIVVGSDSQLLLLITKWIR